MSMICCLFWIYLFWIRLTTSGRRMESLAQTTTSFLKRGRRRCFPSWRNSKAQCGGHTFCINRYFSHGWTASKNEKSVNLNLKTRPPRSKWRRATVPFHKKIISSRNPQRPPTLKQIDSSCRYDWKRCIPGDECWLPMFYCRNRLLNPINIFHRRSFHNNHIFRDPVIVGCTNSVWFAKRFYELWKPSNAFS